MVGLEWSCDENKDLLKDHIEKLNKECPTSIGDILTINSASYAKDLVEMEFIFNENYVSLSTFSSHKEEFKELLEISLSKNNNILHQMVRAKAGFKGVISGGQSGMKTSILITLAELTDALNKIFLMNDSKKTIALTVLSTKMNLPLSVDKSSTLIDLSTSSEGVTYIYEINDIEVGKNMNSNIFKSLMKNITMSQIAQGLQRGQASTRNRQFYQALVNNNDGIIFKYYERNTRNETSFNITSTEISDILTGKYQQNALSTEEWYEFGNALEELERIYGNDSY